MSSLERIRETFGRLLRGPVPSKVLKALGIDPRRYWLLMDLFHELSDRGELMDQLGRNGVALTYIVWLYFAMSVLIGVLLLVAVPTPARYLTIFLLFTAFILLSVLLSETANSLINPVEALVLAHQPIDGATYTAAKLSHLVRIVFYLVPACDVVPALLGLTLKGAPWFYPLLHLGAALAVGLVAAMFCSALFGWLIRFLPARRLKLVGQLAGTLPFLGAMWMDQIRRFFTHFHVSAWLPEQAAGRWALGSVSGAVILAVAAFGVRCLSADYLIRVSSMVRSGATAGSKGRKSRIGGIVARYFGGQPGRAGFAFVSRMMLRDWQFRRLLFPIMVPALIGLGGLLVSGWRTDPFSQRFTTLHLLPHSLGILLFLVCALLPYGNDYKGAWIFLLAPARATAGFARGTHALLWIEIIVIPHVLLCGALAWTWGLWHAALFAAYSVAAASVYLALELRLIDGAPFTKQIDPSRSSQMMLVMFGGFAVAIAVGIQYFLIFRSPVVVVSVTCAIAAVAYWLTRSSVRAFAASMRYNFGLLSAEAGTLYKEVGV